MTIRGTANSRKATAVQYSFALLASSYAGNARAAVVAAPRGLVYSYGFGHKFRLDSASQL